MSKSSTSTILDPKDDYPTVTQSDLDRAKFRVGRMSAPRKKRVTIMLDTTLIEYFRGISGDRGYQTLINETLRHAMEQESLETSLRRIIREELGRQSTTAGA